MMNLDNLKKRNRALLILLFFGLLCYLFVEWTIALMEEEAAEWESVNSDVEKMLDWEPEELDESDAIININEATAKQLESLKGIGPKKAEEIVNYREANGPFLTIEQLMEVKGIGEATFENVKEQITVGDVPTGHTGQRSDDRIHSEQSELDVEHDVESVDSEHESETEMEIESIRETKSETIEETAE